MFSDYETIDENWKTPEKKFIPVAPQKFIFEYPENPYFSLFEFIDNVKPYKGENNETL